MHGIPATNVKPDMAPCKACNMYAKVYNALHMFGGTSDTTPNIVIREIANVTEPSENRLEGGG